MFTGAGVSVLLLNVLHRIGVDGNSVRDSEEEARRYFDEHGHWPRPGSTLLVEQASRAGGSGPASSHERRSQV